MGADGDNHGINARYYSYTEHMNRLAPRLTVLSRQLSNFRMSFPSTIKAIVAPKHGDVDVIDIVELPFPKQGPNEILVKVRRW